MAAITATTLIIGALIAAIGSIASSGISSGLNYASTKNTNDANIEMQNSVNAQNQFNMEHAHQIEMQDLKAAGLNPVLTATGGSGAPLANIQAPKAQAPQVDLSGVSTALSGMMNMIMMSSILSEKNSIIQQQADLMADRNASIVAMNEARAGYYNRHSAEQFAKTGMNEASKLAIHHPKQMFDGKNYMDQLFDYYSARGNQKEWDDMIDYLTRGYYKKR